MKYVKYYAINLCYTVFRGLFTFTFTFKTRNYYITISLRAFTAYTKVTTQLAPFKID